MAKEPKASLASSFHKTRGPSLGHEGSIFSAEVPSLFGPRYWGQSASAESEKTAAKMMPKLNRRIVGCSLIQSIMSTRGQHPVGAHQHDAGRDILRHDGIRADGRPSPDSDASEDFRPRSNVNSVFDLRRLSSQIAS